MMNSDVNTPVQRFHVRFFWRFLALGSLLLLLLIQGASFMKGDTATPNTRTYVANHNHVVQVHSSPDVSNTLVFGLLYDDGPKM